jgi:hypothetical protein
VSYLTYHFGLRANPGVNTTGLIVTAEPL